MFAVWATLIGLILGIFGDILFFRNHIGLSFPLYVVFISIILVSSSPVAQKKIWWRNGWPLVFIVLFAFMIAFRASPRLIFFNFCAMVVLGSLTVFYLTLEKPLDEGTLFEHFTSINEAWVGMIFAPFHVYSKAWAWTRQQKWTDHPAFFAVVRGLFITVPVVIVFAILLGAADAVFGEYVSDFLSYFTISGDSIQHIMFILVLAMGVTAMLGYTYLTRNYRYEIEDVKARREGKKSQRNVDVEVVEKIDAEELSTTEEKEPRKPFRLGIIESGMLLASVDMLFAAFVAIQFTYFFGGEKNIEGMVYSEYARRGFFELLAVSILTLSMMLVLDKITIWNSKRQLQTLRGLMIFMVGLMFVILVSASQRMNLYEEAYGYTQLRVYVDVFIYWLAVLFIVFLLQLFRLKLNVFAFGVVLVAIGYLLTLNIMNVDGYIASHNVERFKNGKQLDICYFQDLSLDAVPALVELYELTKTDEYAEINQQIASRLRDHLEGAEKDYYNSNDFFLFQHLAGKKAYETLNPMRDELLAIEYVYPFYCFTYSR